MNELELSVILMALLFAVLGSGVWIAIALAVCGFAAVLTKVATPAGQVLATSMWALTSWRRISGTATGAAQVRQPRQPRQPRARRRSRGRVGGQGFMERLEERWRRRQRGDL